MNFNEIPKYVINLKERKDRLLSIQKEFKKQNINVKVFPAIDGNKLIIPKNSRKIKEYNAKSIYGCMQSHYNLIKLAKENNYPYIAIFEDDITFCIDFKNRIDNIKNLDFDMFYMGSQFDRLGIDVTCTSHKHIFKCHHVGGTYAYILKSTAYDYILNNMSYNWGADEFYAERVQNKFNCLAFIPFMVGHLDGYSDVAKNDMVYKNVSKYFQKKKIL